MNVRRSKQIGIHGISKKAQVVIYTGQTWESWLGCKDLRIVSPQIPVSWTAAALTVENFLVVKWGKEERRGKQGEAGKLT